jgi:hypothetical protein
MLSPEHRRATALIAVSVAAIALATLVALPDQAEMVALTSPWCLVCGAVGAVDVVLNLALFFPLGAALRLRGLRLRTITGFCFALTLTLELVQGLIPGRDPSLSDVLTNTLGGTLGGAAVAWAPHLIRPTRGLAAALGAGWAALWLAQTAAVAALLDPALPRSWYWGQLAPDLAQFEQFDGQVLSGAVGTTGLYIGRLARSTDVRAALLSGEPLRATTTPGTFTAGLAPIVSIFDEEQREIALVGRWGDDLVFRLRTRTADFRLRAPAVRLPGAFSGAAGIVDASGHYHPDSGTFVVAIGPAARHWRLDPQWGWGLLLPFPYAHGPESTWLTAGWLILWMAVLGYWSSAAGLGAVLPAAAVGATGLGPLPALLGLSPAPAWQWAAGAVGLTIGAVLAIRLARGAPPHRKTA